MSSLLTGAIGPESLPITYTLENDTTYDRTEIVGIMGLFPDDANGVNSLSDYHFYLDGGRETIGWGSGASFTTNYQFSATIPWVAALNAVTATSGNLLPGSLQITLYYSGYQPFPTLKQGKITITDTPINGTTGQWTHPAVASSSVNYTTGAISITFDSTYAPFGGKPIRLTYRYANPVKYPTQWTVLRTWPSGKVRQAKAWIGQASGVGMLVSKKITSITMNPGSVSQTPEFTRVYLRVGKDATVNTNLPTYTVHSSLATALNPVGSSIQSQVFDSNNCDYYAGLLSGQAYEEYAIEDPANNSGKGWMKVIQRRNYHTNAATSSKFGHITRDFLSVTSYLYIPHNQRMMEMEVRLGNDYQGADPFENQFTESLGSGDSFTTTFTQTAVNVFPNSDGRHGHLRRGRVYVYIDGIVVAHDKMGNGVLQSRNGVSLTGSVNYATGQVSVTFATPPTNGSVITFSYKSYYIKIGVATGVQTLNYTLDNKPSQYGVHVRVGGGATALYEGWDGGGSYGASTGQIVPYAFTPNQPAQVAAGPLSTTTTGTLATNLVPGTVEFFADTTDAGVSSTTFCRDNGSGTLSGRNVSTGTIDYVTGAFSITFSSTPATNLNLYAAYGRTTTARPISGSVNYSTKVVSVTTSQSVPAGTPVFVSYIRNNLSGKNHDPNMHPLGSVGLNKWVMLWNGTNFTDVFCEGGDAFKTYPGGTTTKFAAVLGTGGQVPSGGPDTQQHEHLHDGSSVSRTFFIYAGTGASSADNNSWAAKKSHVLQTIPTLDAYTSTRAYGLLEGGLRILTPEQNPPAEYQTTRRAYSEDLGRSIPAGVINKANQFSCVAAWNGGTPTGAGVGPAYPRDGARGHLGWRENVFEGVNSGGAQRALHDSSVFFLYPQAWQGVRYLYQASHFNAVRPGAIFWNLATRSKWEDRAWHNYIPTSPSNGMVIGGTPVQGTYTYDSMEYLNRGWRSGFGHGFVTVTNNSTRVEFNPVNRLVWNSATQQYDQVAYVNFLNIWNSADPNTGTGGAFYTPNGTATLTGKRRVAIEGSYRYYTLSNVFYDTAAGKWVGTLDNPFRGPTATNVSYGMFCDPRPGVDIVDQRNDPRLFPQIRLGCGRVGYQHGIEGDSSSHQSAWSSFDVWNVTGSWLLWDISRHLADWNMTSVKELKNGGFFQDQMRTNAWTHRSVITAYALTKDLSGAPGFGFLTDPVYGAAKDRYADWIRTRWTQWINLGAKGEMDPAGTIATGGKERIKDIRITSSSNKADWYSMAKIGSPNPAYGGSGSFNGTSWVGPTEAEVRFGPGFDYVSVWEIGYLTPWMAATYREFRFDQTVVSLPNRGEPDTTFGSAITRIFNAYAAFMVDYGFLVGTMNVTSRGAPGFISVSTWNNPDPQVLPWRNDWGPNLDASVGTPVSFVQNPTFADRVYKTFDQVTWPTSDDNYIAEQVYWLRAASHAFDNTVSEGIDRLGHPIPGTTSSVTTFEGGWHDPGIPFSGNPIIPANQTNPIDTSDDKWPIVRAPQRGEACNTVGRTWSNSENLLWACVPFLMQVARFSTSATRRARAGDVVNRILWQTRAMSLISGVYDQSVQEYNQGDTLETNYFAGPITGDFPYVDNSGGQPLDRWWNPSFLSRRKIVSGTGHTIHTGGVDVFVVDLTATGVAAKLIQQDGSDVRIVRQLVDGTNQVCSSVVRQNASGNYSVFAVTPVDLLGGQAIVQNSVTESWYIYYSNPSSTAASWGNVNSIDGPFSVDSSTKVLWNQNGNYTTDAGPNNWPLSTFSLLEPDYVDGPFGGAVSIDRNNVDVAYSQQALALAQEGSNYLGSAFSFDFFFNVPVRNYEKDRLSNYGIFSIADSSIFPTITYIEGTTGRFITTLSLGGTASGYTLTSVAATGPTRSVVGTGNGSLTTFTSNIGSNRLPGRVSVVVTNGSNLPTVYAQDNGVGGFTGSGVASGTINYSSGAISITTSVAVPNAAQVIAYSTNSLDKWSTGSWNHARITYNGSRILLIINGTTVGSVLTSGNLQQIAAGAPSGVALGAFFTPATGFTAQSVIKIAEFRVRGQDSGSPSKVASPLVVTLLGEESTLTSRTGNPATVAAYVAPLRAATVTVDTKVAVSIVNSSQTADMLLLRGQFSASQQVGMSVMLASIAVPQAATATLALPASGSAQAHASVAGLQEHSSPTCTGLVTFAPAPITAAVVCDIIGLKFHKATAEAYILSDVQQSTAEVGCAIQSNGTQQTTNTVGACLTVSRSSFATVAATVAIQGTATGRVDLQVVTLGQHRSPRLTASVQTSSQATSTVSCVVAGFSSVATASAAANIARLATATATVVMDLYANGGPGSTVVAVAGSIQVAQPAVTIPVSSSVAVPALLQSNSVTASIQTSSAAIAPVNVSVQINDLSVFLLGAASVQMSRTTTNDVAGRLATSGYSYADVATSIVATDLGVTLPVSAWVTADLTLAVAPVAASILYPADQSSSIDCAGFLSKYGEAVIDAAINFAELKYVNLECAGFLAASTVNVFQACSASIADEQQVRAAVTARIARARHRSAVCRATIVLPKASKLQASSVGTTTPQAQ